MLKWNLSDSFSFFFVFYYGQKIHNDNDQTESRVWTGYT